MGDQPNIPAAVAPALRFLQAEKRKQVAATGLTPAITTPVVAAPALHFYHRKSKNIYLWPAWHTCSCCPRVTIYTSGKVKIGTCNQPDTPAAAASAFASKKAKTAKNILDKRALAAGIAAPVLRFLQVKKRKHIRTTGLTSCRHSCWYIYFRITIFTSGKAKIRIYDQSD